METLFVGIGIYACVVIMFVTVMFLAMQLWHDNSLIDIAYGPMFFLSSVATLALTQTQGILPIIIAAAMGVWAIRLGVRIAKKNWRRSEDARYKAWRTEWMKRGKLYFIIRSFLQINLLQGIIIIGVSLPFLIALNSPEALLLPWVIAGGCIFLIGLTIESIADWQLDAFIDKKKSGKPTPNLLTTGLFTYSRRPNYFGETLIWWGLAVMVLPLPYGTLALVSPLLITFIVTKVTGPMLEAIFLKNYGDEYRAYMKKTSYFIPWKPKA